MITFIEETKLEKTKHRKSKPEQFYVFDEPTRDPRERTITVVFTVQADHLESSIKAASDAKEARWLQWLRRFLLSLPFQNLINSSENYLNER